MKDREPKLKLPHSKSNKRLMKQLLQLRRSASRWRKQNVLSRRQKQEKLRRRRSELLKRNLPEKRLKLKKLLQRLKKNCRKHKKLNRPESLKNRELPRSRLLMLLPNRQDKKRKNGKDKKLKQRLSVSDKKKKLQLRQKDLLTKQLKLKELDSPRKLLLPRKINKKRQSKMSQRRRLS